MSKQKKIFSLTDRDSTFGLWRFRDTFNGEYPNHSLTEIVTNEFTDGYTEDGLTAIKVQLGGGCKLPAIDATDFDLANRSITIEAIFRHTSSGGNSPIQKISGLSGYLIGFALGHPYFVLGDGSQTKILTGSTVIPSLGGWYYLVGVIDRVNNQSRIYINGTEDSNSPLDITGLGSISSPATDLLIGSFNGYLDEVCFSEEVLSDNAIIERYEGKWIDAHPDKRGFFLNQLPAVFHGNEDISNFLNIIDDEWSELQTISDDLNNLTDLERCPDYLLDYLSSSFGFELISSRYADSRIRRKFIKSIAWIYKNKGTKLAADKFIELLEFDFTSEESFPAWVPIILNHHKIFSRSNAELNDFYDNFDNLNLNKWNVPLSFNCWWRISKDIDGTGHLRGTGDTTNIPEYAILFDSILSDQRMLVEFQIIDGWTTSVEFGFYIKYINSNNYVQMVIRNSGLNIKSIMFLKKVAGVTGASASYNIDSIPIESGIHTVSIFYNSASESYTVAIDDQTIIYNLVFTSSGVAGTKKGLWIGRRLTVEFNLVQVSYLDTKLLTKIYIDDFAKKYFIIQINNTPDFKDERIKYLQEVLPKYLPIGVHIAWRVSPVPITATAFIDGSIIKYGFDFSGDKGLVAKAIIDGTISVKSSVNIIPSPLTAKTIIEFKDIIIVPEPIIASAHIDKTSFKIGFDFTGINAKTARAIIDGCRITTIEPLNVGLFKDSDGSPYTSTLTSDSDLKDGNKTTQAITITASKWSIGGKLISSGSICCIKLYDTYSTELNGLLASNNRLQVFSSSDGASWISPLGGPLVATRNNKVTTISFEVIPGRYFKAWAIDQGLKSPDGTLLQFAEIEFYKSI